MQDVENARRYVAMLQGVRSPTFRHLAAGGSYGTSVLLHEVVEVRILLGQDPGLLRRPRAQAITLLESNLNAHVEGLKAEYRYLWEKIRVVLGEAVGVGELVKANASNIDLELLHASDLDLPIFLPTEAKIARAHQLLSKLKAIDRSWPR